MNASFSSSGSLPVAVCSYGDWDTLFNHHDQHHCHYLEKSSTETENDL